MYLHLCEEKYFDIFACEDISGIIFATKFGPMMPGIKPGIRLVGGECYHHCTIPASVRPDLLINNIQSLVFDVSFK